MSSIYLYRYLHLEMLKKNMLVKSTHSKTILNVLVTLVGARTHDVVQKFTKFELVLDPLDPGAPRTPRAQGQFQLFADTLSRFDEECTNSVIEADDLPKTEVQVMWKAPPAGSGCVLIK